MTRENAQDRGRRLLTEGRLIVEAAGDGYFSATIRGSGDVHVVSYARGGWCCSCPAKATCSHLHAARLIAAPTAARLITSRSTP